MVGTLSTPKFPGVRPVPSTGQTGVSQPQTSGRETPGSSKGKGRGKRTKNSDGPSTSGGDGGRKDGGGVAGKGGGWGRGVGAVLQKKNQNKNKNNKIKKTKIIIKKRWCEIEILARVAVVTCTNYHKTALFRATKFSQRKKSNIPTMGWGCCCCV